MRREPVISIRLDKYNNFKNSDCLLFVNSFVTKPQSPGFEEFEFLHVLTKDAISHL